MKIATQIVRTLAVLAVLGAFLAHGFLTGPSRSASAAGNRAGGLSSAPHANRTAEDFIVLKLKDGATITSVIDGAGTTKGKRSADFQVTLNRSFPLTTIHLLEVSGNSKKALNQLKNDSRVLWAESGSKVANPNAEQFSQTAPEQFSQTAFEQFSQAAYEQFSQAVYEQFSQTVYEQFSQAAYEQFSQAVYEQFSQAAYEQFSQTVYDQFSQTVYEQFSQAAYEQFSQAVYEQFSQAVYDQFSQTAYEQFSQAVYEQFSQALYEQFSQAVFDQFSQAVYEQFTQVLYDQFSQAAYEQFSQALYEVFIQVLNEQFSQAVYEQFSQVLYEQFSQVILEQFSQSIYEQFSQALYEQFSQVVFEEFSEAAYEQFVQIIVEQFSQAFLEQFSQVIFEQFSQAVFEQFAQAIFEQFSQAVFEQFSQVIFEQFSQIFLEQFSQAIYEQFSQVIFEQFSQVAYEQFSQAIYEQFSQVAYEQFSNAIYLNFSEALYEQFTQVVYEQLAIEMPDLSIAAREELAGKMAASAVESYFQYFTSLTADQQALSQINAGAAQEQATGTGVLVAVLDTGISPNHWMVSNVISGGLDLIQGDYFAAEGQNQVDDNGNGVTDEGFGHGTYVAGLIGLVAPDAEVIPVRVLDDEGAGWSFILAEGILRAVQMGANVINISASIPNDSFVVRDAVEYATKSGVIIVAAAGNGGDQTKLYPAAYGDVLGVAAVDGTDQKATFSNYGNSLVDVAAPGVDIIGPYPAGTGFVRWSGTSFSAALVSGEAALLKQIAPSATAGKVADAVREGAVRLNKIDSQYGNHLGSGRIDIAASIAALQ